MAETYPCVRCGGKGRLPSFSNVLGGVCFKCGGSGRQATKPAARGVKWAVMGTVRETGHRVRLYNETAKTSADAISRARAAYAKASAEFQATYDLTDAIAVDWDEQNQLDALDEYYQDRGMSGRSPLEAHR